MPKMLEIVARRRLDDGVPELFMIEAGELTCYAHVGQHSAASREYFLEYTRPANPKDADVRKLIDEWDNLGPKVAFRVMRRLKWWSV